MKPFSRLKPLLLSANIVLYSSLLSGCFETEAHNDAATAIGNVGGAWINTSTAANEIEITAVTNDALVDILTYDNQSNDCAVGIAAAGVGLISSNATNPSVNTEALVKYHEIVNTILSTEENCSGDVALAIGMVRQAEILYASYSTDSTHLTLLADTRSAIEGDIESLNSTLTSDVAQATGLIANGLLLATSRNPNHNGLLSLANAAIARVELETNRSNDCALGIAELGAGWLEAYARNPILIVDINALYVSFYDQLILSAGTSCGKDIAQAIAIVRAAELYSYAWNPALQTEYLSFVANTEQAIELHNAGDGNNDVAQAIGSIGERLLMSVSRNPSLAQNLSDRANIGIARVLLESTRDNDCALGLGKLGAGRVVGLARNPSLSQRFDSIYNTIKLTIIDDAASGNTQCGKNIAVGISLVYAGTISAIALRGGLDADIGTALTASIDEIKATDGSY